MRLPISIALAASISAAQSVQISTDKADYLLGEPVYLRMEASAAPEYPLELESGIYELNVTHGKESFRYRSPVQTCRTQPSATGYPQSGYATLVVSEGKLLFENPGKYRLQLLKSGEVVSAYDAEISFSAPRAAADQKAYAAIRRAPAEYGLVTYLEGGEHLKDGFAVIEELAGFPSVYQASAAFTLASNYLETAHDFAAKKTREIDLAKALGLSHAPDRAAFEYVRLATAYKLKSAEESLASRGKAIGQAERLEMRRQIESVRSDFPQDKSKFRKMLAE